LTTYFTTERKNPAGLNDTLNSFRTIYAVMHQLTTLPYVFTPFKFAHMPSSSRSTFYKYFGFEYHYEQLTADKFKNYTIIRVDLNDALKKCKGNPEAFKNYFPHLECVIYSIIYSSGQLHHAVDELLERAFLRSRCNYTLQKIFMNPQALRFRKSLAEHSLFKQKDQHKLFINYRMADFALLKLEKTSWYDYTTDNFYHSKKEVVEVRKGSNFPFVPPERLIFPVKKYLNSHANAEVVLTSDGYIERPKLKNLFKDHRELQQFLGDQTLKTLSPLLEYCNRGLYVGRSPSRLLVILQTLFDSSAAMKCPGQLSGFINLKAQCLQQKYNLSKMPYLWNGDEIYNN
jgi:hypothetical protein